MTNVNVKSIWIWSYLEELKSVGRSNKGEISRLPFSVVSRRPAGTTLRVEDLSRWKPPAGGTLKLNIDGACGVCGRPTGFGTVIRNVESTMLVAS